MCVYVHICMQEVAHGHGSEARAECGCAGLLTTPERMCVCVCVCVYVCMPVYEKLPMVMAAKHAQSVAVLAF